MQEELFLDRAKPEASFHERILEVDRERRSAEIMVEGFSFTFRVRQNELHLDAFTGATYQREIPKEYIARARNLASGILRPGDGEHGEKQVRDPKRESSESLFNE
jgi:hypothetical protein